MTRISGYDLLACPSCRHVHRKTSYSSISVYIPNEYSSTDDRTCAKCHNISELSEFVKVGFVNPHTEVSQAELANWINQSKNTKSSSLSRVKEKIADGWASFVTLFTSKRKKSWEQFPPLR